MTPATGSGDAELVNASLAGNREAFGQIVSRYQSLVCSLAYSATGSLSQSEDLAQETFFAAWKHLAELREPAKLRAWLCGIARNLINNSLRTQGREPSHRAESLDEIPEPRSAEPLPVERAIGKEEAEILWRSLERIPETYRVPLVLFYREHQSVQAVAQDLELTEEAVRQRLSRGRKLLQEEVLAFVEVALDKTAPGTAFTVAVVAALPIAVTSAKAASVGAAVAKGGAGAKSAFSLGALGSLAAMLGPVLFCWKMAADETKSPPERRLIVRTAWFQIALLVLSMAAGFYGLPRLYRHPLAMGAGLALLVVANVVNGVLLLDHLGRRQTQIKTQIMMEEGTWADAEWSGPGRETDRKAFRKAAKLTIPFLIMFGFGGIGLPWKEHWLRCAALAAGEGLVIFWVFRRFQKMLSPQFLPIVPDLRLSRIQALWRQPIILFPAIAFGSVLLGVGVTLYLCPGGAEALVFHSPWPRTMGLSLLGAMAAYAIFAVIFVKKRGMAQGADALMDKIYGPLPREPGASSAPGRMGGFVLNKTLGLTTKLMGPMMVKRMANFYTPFLEQTNLSVEQRAQLKDLIVKKQSVNWDKGLPLMNAKLEPERRAAAIEEMKSAREGCDAQIRQLLGETIYPAFDQFGKTIPDRLVLALFRSKSASTGRPLSAEQQDQLLAAMTDARSRFNWSTDLSRRIQNPANLVAMFSEDNINTFAREEEEFDGHFLTHAATILTPAQLAVFGPFQAKQRQATIASMKMTSKMFTPRSR
jgi:RNA polymerase sigma factor (sigma-70 family)